MVCKYLGIGKLKDARKDWYVFRTALNNSNIQEELKHLPERIREASAGAPLEIDNEPLRLLDAALWRFAIDGNER